MQNWIDGCKLIRTIEQWYRTYRTMVPLAVVNMANTNLLQNIFHGFVKDFLTILVRAQYGWFWFT